MNDNLRSDKSLLSDAPSQVASYFSNSYKEARNKFLNAAKAANLDVESCQNPSNAPDNSALYTDIVFFGDKRAKSILVLISGTHGVEGFAGAGIQTGLLQELHGYDHKPHVGILMVHAINPYGFAHLRRFNEDNIDLNRNFIDHSGDYPENKEYVELANAIQPPSLSLFQNIKSYFHFAWYRIKNGKQKLIKAISEGQYTHPKGLFYGGRTETWSNRTIKEIVDRYLSNADRVVVIDFHTGLGPNGYGELISNEPENSMAYKRASNWWGARVKTTINDAAVSPHLSGALKLAIPRMLPRAEVTAVSLEFGTFAPVEVFRALRAENWLHHYGGEKCKDTDKIKMELLRVFYPNTEEWKAKVWKQGKEVVEQVLLNL